MLRGLEMLNSLGEVLPNAERCFGDKTALIVEGQSFSFRDLNDLSGALAASLVTLGVKPGDRITLYAPNSWEWIVSYYGALKTGAVINPSTLSAEVAYVAWDCGAKILIGSPESPGGASRLVTVDHLRESWRTSCRLPELDQYRS
jgi:long-chain acyl-CoA synthetase